LKNVDRVAVIGLPPPKTLKKTLGILDRMRSASGTVMPSHFPPSRRRQWIEPFLHIRHRPAHASHCSQKPSNV